MSFTPLGDTSNQKSNDNAIIEASQNVLEKMFGDIGRQAKPLFLKNRTLTVSCSSSTIAEEIRSNQQEIVDKINEKIGSHERDRIRYLA